MDSDPVNQAIDPSGCGNRGRNAHMEMHEYLVFQTSEILALVWPTFPVVGIQGHTIASPVPASNDF